MAIKKPITVVHSVSQQNDHQDVEALQKTTKTLVGRGRMISGTSKATQQIPRDQQDAMTSHGMASRSASRSAALPAAAR